MSRFIRVDPDVYRRIVFLQVKLMQATGKPVSATAALNFFLTLRLQQEVTTNS